MSKKSASNDWVDPLPGVPDVESPFFEDLFSRKRAPEHWYQAALSLRENGYAVIDFPEVDFEGVADAIRSDLTSAYDFEAWRRDGWANAQGLRVQDAWEYSEPVKRVATNSDLLGLLEYLYGRTAWPFQTLNFPVGTQQNFHSDSVHFSSVPERFMCGVWVALEDIDETNGPLIYYPGSHRLPIFTNEHIGNFAEDVYATGQNVFEPMWRELVRATGLERVQFKARKGQALIWAANLLHGGEKHLNPDRTRWSQVTHYYFDDCMYYTPLNSDPGYGRMYIREPKNVITGRSVENRYIGQRIPQDFLERMKHGRKIYETLPDDFDAAYYLSHYEDVRRSKVDPGTHFIEHGQFENRRFKRGQGQDG